MQPQIKPSDLPRLSADEAEAIHDPYTVIPGLISDAGIALKNLAPRFQRVDTAGQITESDDYVAVLETRFDPLTGQPVKLLWNRELIKVKNWKAGEKACAGLSLCGFTDWRMPTVQERELLTDKSRHGPAIDPLFNSPEYGWEWTSTPAAWSPAVYAWVVYFGGGGGCSLYHHDGSGFVRAVRPSQ